MNLGRTLRRDVIAEPLLAPPLSSGWRVEWSSEDRRYGGHGTPEPFTLKRFAFPARSALLCTPDRAQSLRVESPSSSEKGTCTSTTIRFRTGFGRKIGLRL